MAVVTLHPNQQKLIDRAREFLAEVEDLYALLTPRFRPS